MPDSYFTPIDLYCERLGPEFWAEPVNALSNVAFFVAAWLLLKRVRSGNQGIAPQIGVLIGLIVAIGVGSLLFHTLAVRWAMLADDIPIAGYQFLFLFFYAHSVARLSLPWVAALIVAFVGMSVACAALPERWFNGSLSYYGAALVFAFALGFYHRCSHKRDPHALLLAACVFAIALVFRSVDLQVCSGLSVGTHPLWHVLNSVALYLSVRGVAENLGSPPNRVRPRSL